MNWIFLLLAGNFIASASAVLGSPLITSMVTVTISDYAKLQARKDKTVSVTITETVITTHVTTVFVSVVQTNTVKESIISISSGPTITATTTNSVTTTESVTDTSINSGPTVTDTATSSMTETSSTTLLGPTVTETATPDPTPQPDVEFKHTWILVLIILSCCLGAILLATWPIILIGMALQRRRSRKIQTDLHQVKRNDVNDIPMDDLGARRDNVPGGQSPGRRNDVLDDLDNIPLDDDPPVDMPANHKSAGRAKLRDLAGHIFNSIRS